MKGYIISIVELFLLMKDNKKSPRNILGLYTKEIYFINKDK